MKISYDDTYEGEQLQNNDKEMRSEQNEIRADIKPVQKIPRLYGFSFIYMKKKLENPTSLIYPPTLYTIFLNGVSPVRIWHRPVTIKNETLSFTPPPIPVFVMSLRLNFDMYCLKQIDAAYLRDSSRPAQMTRGPPTRTNDQRPTSQSYE